jgi:hypothetical protein
MTKKQIDAAAAYYARASAIRAVEGVIVDPHAEADAGYWRHIPQSLREDMRLMVKNILKAAAASP